MGQSITGSRSNASTTSFIRRAIRVGIVTISASAMMFIAVAGSASTASAADTGESLFKTNCAVCHGDDGRGTATGKALQAPDLHSEAVQKLTNAQIAAQIENGKGNMPPFKSTLNHAQVEMLVKYVRTFGKKK
ncbi:MAG: c-type cytochrome [Candidatus Acidiferrales bacterium]